uniref:Disease resistance R13L4/SHOC-2-like LRR domain-containing protein n=1 Tax=Timema tahoe TaxID=61484 RepID=A0A7R9ICB6_9NEOP|nr:unnamed protein product [Timema tahoe]
MSEKLSRCSSRRNDNTKTIASETPQSTPRERHMAGGLRTRGAQDLEQDQVYQPSRLASQPVQDKSPLSLLTVNCLFQVPGKVWSLNQLDEAEVRMLETDLDAEDEDKWWSHLPLSSLDLSSNALKVIPANIKHLDTLAVLNLQDNSLDSLPREIGALSKLTRLHLGRNKLRSLPSQFYQLRDLRQLVLSHNQLEELGEDLGDLVMMETLDLSHNSLSSIPAGTGFLTRLTQLNLSYNKLADFPPDLTSLPVLVQLDISHNQLPMLPPLGDLRKLEVLYLQYNCLTDMPDMLGCVALKELHLGRNNISELNVETIESLGHVRVLSLRDNKLSVLPEEINILQHLVRLDLVNNSLTTLPRCLGFLPHLQNLQVEGNPLRSVRSDIVQCGTVRLMKFLRQRVEGEEGVPRPGSREGIGEVSDFPDRYTMRSCRSLNVASKELGSVPTSVFEEACEAEVTSVDLSKNCLSQMPDGLFRLSDKLTDLNLSCNSLTSVPKEIVKLWHLQYLALDRNMLTDLPQELATMDKLRELVLSYNKFQDIPECVYDLKGLEILAMRGNKLSTISVAGLARLKRLAVLDLADNNISQVPPQLGNLTQLRTLELAGNGFRQPRHAILEKGTHFVLAYLRDRIPGGP